MPKRSASESSASQKKKKKKDEAYYRALANRAVLGVERMLEDISTDGDVADLFSYCTDESMDAEDVKFAWNAFRRYAGHRSLLRLADYEQLVTMILADAREGE